MFHKAKSVAALSNFRLLVHFWDGTVKKYNMLPLMDRYPVYKAFLSRPDLFFCAKVDQGGFGISWNEDIDIDSEEIWQNGLNVHSPFEDLLSFNDASTIWELNESTLRKAVSYGKLIEGIDVQKFGKQWIVTRSAMEREYGKIKEDKELFIAADNSNNNMITLR